MSRRCFRECLPTMHYVKTEDVSYSSLESLPLLDDIRLFPCRGTRRSVPRRSSIRRASFGLRYCERHSLMSFWSSCAVFRLQLVRGEQSETERIVERSWMVPCWGMRRRRSASSCFYDADASSEAGCSRDQEQPRPDGDGPGGSGDALTGRCETLDRDSCRHDCHRAKVHDPDDQEDRHQTETALAAVEAVSQGRAGVRGQRKTAPGCLSAATKVTRLRRSELEGAGNQDDHADQDRYSAPVPAPASRSPPARRPVEKRPFRTWSRPISNPRPRARSADRGASRLSCERPRGNAPGGVGSAHGRVLGDGRLVTGHLQRRPGPVVVFITSLALLLLGELDVEVEVEVAAERRRPGERPPHAPLERLQLRERRPRYRRKRDVVIGQVDDGAVEPVRDRRAGRTPRRVVGPEHEVVEEELRAASEEVCQRGAPLVGLESILPVDPNPGQLLTPPRQLVAAPR